MNSADQPRRACAEVKINLACAQALGDTVFAQGHSLYFRGSRQGRQDYVAGLRHLPRRVGPHGARLQVASCRPPPDVMDHQLMAAQQGIVRHAAAHGAQPDKAYLHILLRLAAIAPPEHFLHYQLALRPPQALPDCMIIAVSIAAAVG